MRPNIDQSVCVMACWKSKCQTLGHIKFCVSLVTRRRIVHVQLKVGAQFNHLNDSNRRLGEQDGWARYVLVEIFLKESFRIVPTRGQQPTVQISAETYCMTVQILFF